MKTTISDISVKNKTYSFEAEKRVAIVTIISQNYGNRLQNYALQEAIKKNGVDVETIPLQYKTNFERKIKLLTKTILSKVLNKYSNDIIWELFDKKIKWSKYTAENPEISSKYDYFIAGSDQIWNPIFPFNSDREFLTFTNDDEKKVAYAASIGLEKLPTKCKEKYKNNIAKFKKVSVREEAAADIIEQLGCKRPEVVLDPTMLLLPKEWEELAQKANVILPEKYVVKYFLGIQNLEFNQYIDQYAKKRCAEVVDITSCDKIGPTEFLKIIYDSEAVFTDSFHGSVFSILFHKPFIVFERPYEEGYGKMSSRLDTLLHTFSLNEQRVSSVSEYIEKNTEWDYKNVDLILQEKRSFSLQILKNAIEINI